MGRPDTGLIAALTRTPHGTVTTNLETPSVLQPSSDQTAPPKPYTSIPPPSLDQAALPKHESSPAVGASDQPSTGGVEQPHRGTVPLPTDNNVVKPQIPVVKPQIPHELLFKDAFPTDADPPPPRLSTSSAVMDGSAGKDGAEMIHHVRGERPTPSLAVGVFLKSDPTSPSLFIVPMNLPRGISEGRLSHGQVTLQPSLSPSSAASVRPTGRSQLPPAPVEPKWVIDQLVSHLKISARQGQTEIRVQLRPEHLGHVVIRVVATEDGTLSGKIYVANQDVKNLLLSDISSLHKALHDQGLTFSDLDVLVADEFAHGSFDEPPERSQPFPLSASRIPAETADSPINEEFLREVYGYRMVNISA